ncbi:hypothetical protein T08_9046 [Trichinella sp. T8]|nr:hypothetical protein T08_9046 [Trichinella sp. T8]
MVAWWVVQGGFHYDKVVEIGGRIIPLGIDAGRGESRYGWSNDWCKKWRCGTHPCVGGGRVWGGESSQNMRWKCGEQEYNAEMKGASVGMDVGWLSGLHTTLKVLRDEWTTGIQNVMGDGLGDNGYT